MDHSPWRSDMRRAITHVNARGYPRGPRGKTRGYNRGKARVPTQGIYNSLYTTVPPKPEYGLEDIKKLCQGTTADILPDFLPHVKDFQKFISSVNLDQEVFLWVMILANRASESTFHKLKKDIILAISYNESFMNSFENHLIRLPNLYPYLLGNNYTFDVYLNKFWANFIEFTKFLFNYSPIKSGCYSFLKKGSMCLEALGIESLNQEIALLMDKNNFSQNPSIIQGVPDDFRQISVLPHKSEIITEGQIFLRPNTVVGSYSSVDDYLDVQFRLLREDCLSNLRHGINTYRRDSGRRRYDNIRVYKNVKFLEFRNIKNQVGYCVQWQSVPSKGMKNKFSINKRFLFGSLLLFTSDNFESIIFATVLDRDQDLLSKGQIMVTIPISDGSIKQLYSTGFTMIESEVYFEPYNHVLKALQSQTLAKSFPMKQYIIDAHPFVSQPSYLKDSTTYNIMETSSQRNVRVPVLNLENWPEAAALSLNLSQYEAFKLALTKEFVIIQGPPGTGKTHLGLKVARTLIRNSISLQKKNPILVICYTNHALDQFLEGLLNDTQNIVRIGGQSRNTKLDDYNITSLRKKQKKTILAFKSDYNAKLKDTMNMICQLREEQRGADKLISFPKLTSWLWLSFGLELNQLVPQWLFGFKISNELIDDSETISYGRIERKIKQIEEQINELEKQIEGDARSQRENNVARNSISRFNENVKTLQKVLVALENRMTRGASGYRDFILNEDTNLHTLLLEDRWSLYFTSHENSKAWVSTQLQELEVQYKDTMDIVEELKVIQDRTLLAEAQVIGMTTTSAARLQPLLQCLQLPIVIVEEAAEVFEAHIIASLTQHCQHLLLIGDHQQLRPSCASYEIGKQFNLQISLFERMIKNGINCRTLQVQHRMRPEIASLISPIIYKNLENHSSVEEYPPVKGVLTSLYFINHNHFEEKQSITEDMSRSNRHEANFLIALAIYLRQQGYQPEEITILTAYNGQMFLMRDMQKEHDVLRGVLITAVDNYQGEENRIILLSLVRSNPDNAIGFLSIENRVCVALSRAKEGLYITGNMDCLEKKSKLWQEINKTLHRQHCISNELPLKCDNHCLLTKVGTAEDFKKVPRGNCMSTCNGLQKCGHVCRRLCHTNSESHTQLKCLSPCNRTLCEVPISDHPCPLLCWEKCQKCTVKVLKGLPCGHFENIECSLDPKDYKCLSPCNRTLCEVPISDHPCPLLCWEKCQKCTVKVLKGLPCGHFENIECSVDPKDYKCLVPIELVVESCGHKNVIICFENVGKILCREPCLDRLQCGHSCAYACHIGTNPDHVGVVCEKPCARRKNDCSATGEIEGHMCQRKCSEECSACTEMVNKKRTKCSHRINVECSASPDLTMCKEKCSRKIPFCGHHCTFLCGQPCECSKELSVRSINCSHTVKVTCGKNPTRAACKETCDRRLICGHPCKQKCKDDCQDKLCKELVPRTQKSPCGHPVLVPCNITQKVLSEQELLTYCKAKCTAVLECEHLCGGDCSSCYQGRIHLPCKAACDRFLLCGHKCEVSCSEFCPPCKKRCEVRCVHSRCSSLCSDVCAHCVEPCRRKCPHQRCTKKCYMVCSVDPCDEPCSKTMKCKHRCRGLCGEVCPDICNICEPDTFPEDFITLMPFEDDDKFVKLIDCSHVMEVGGLDSWMNVEGDGSVMVRACPLCKAPIINTPRYERQIKGIFETDIREIKKRISGDKHEIRNELDQLLEKIIKVADTVEYKPLNGNNNWLNLLDHMALYMGKGERKLNLVDVEILRFSCYVIEVLPQLMIKALILSPGPLLDNLNREFDMIVQVIVTIKDKLSTQLQNDVKTELRRLSFILQYLPPKNAFAGRFDERIISNIIRMKPYDEAAALVLLKNYQRTSGYITIEEKDMVVKAMGLTQGHWFKCPNNHYYCIDACGGAMQQSACPECGESIGGTQHRLLASNRLAGEIDGALRGAWPGGP